MYRLALNLTLTPRKHDRESDYYSTTLGYKRAGSKGRAIERTSTVLIYPKNALLLGTTTQQPVLQCVKSAVTNSMAAYNFAPPMRITSTVVYLRCSSHSTIGGSRSEPLS